MKNYDVVIAGAGSIGLPLSLSLARKGMDVCVLEKYPSFGRGENRAAIGGIRATHSDPAKIKICRMSLDIVSNMEEETGFDVGWMKGGYLFPVYEADHEIALKDLLNVQRKFELNIDWIDPNHISELVPGIKMEGLRGGTFSPDDGSASPLKLAAAFYRQALDFGVDFYFNEEILSIEKKNEKIEKVITRTGAFSGGLFINAAGSHGREIALMAGDDIPVYPDSHEAGITEPVKHFFKPMVVDIRSDDKSDNYYFYQNDEGQVVFCITPRPKHPGTDYDATSEFLPLVVKRMLQLYPRLRNLRVRRTWRGCYPMTPDGFPIVGYSKKTENLFHTAGMCGQGFMLGPGLGRIISEIICENNRSYDFILDQLSPYRSFNGNEILK